MRFLVWALLSICGVAPLLSGEKCAELGSFLEDAQPARIASITENSTRWPGGVVDIEGELIFEFEVHKLCGPGQAVCLDLEYARGELGEGLFTINPILEQWNGSRVRAQGTLTAVFRSKPRLRVTALRPIDRPPAESFCLGYSGPLEPSVAEVQGRGGSHKLTDMATYLPERILARADRYQAVAHLDSLATGERRSIAFSVPPPFSGRDVLEFGALTQSRFIFRLANNRLYLWDGRKTVEIEPPFVDRIAQNLPNGGYYYRVRAFGPDRALKWNALKRIAPDLESEVVWESTEDQLVGYRSVGPLRLILRRPGSEELRWFEFSDIGGFVELEDGD